MENNDCPYSNDEYSLDPDGPCKYSLDSDGPDKESLDSLYLYLYSK